MRWEMPSYRHCLFDERSKEDRRQHDQESSSPPKESHAGRLASGDSTSCPVPYGILTSDPRGISKKPQQYAGTPAVLLFCILSLLPRFEFTKRGLFSVWTFLLAIPNKPALEVVVSTKFQALFSSLTAIHWKKCSFSVTLIHSRRYSYTNPSPSPAGQPISPLHGSAGAKTRERLKKGKKRKRNPFVSIVKVLRSSPKLLGTSNL